MSSSCFVSLRFINKSNLDNQRRGIVHACVGKNGCGIKYHGKVLSIAQEQGPCTWYCRVPPAVKQSCSEESFVISVQLYHAAVLISQPDTELGPRSLSSVTAYETYGLTATVIIIIPLLPWYCIPRVMPPRLPLDHAFVLLP